MKKILLTLCVILLLSNLSFSQIVSYRSESYSYKMKIGQTGWSEWSEPEKSSLLIRLDLDKGRYTIYSKEKKTFDMIEDQGLATDSDGDEFWTILCVDQSGIYCKVTLARLHSQKRHQFYIEYDDVMILYNIQMVE